MFGAEMGASIMNALISLTQSGDRSQFRRAFAAATMNDIYNFLCYLVFLPIEILFAPVERLSALIVSPLSHIKAGQIKTLNALTDPLLDRLIQIDSDAIRAAALQNSTNSGKNLSETFVRRCINMETKEELTFCPYNHIFAHSTWSDTWIGLTLLAISLGLLVVCLIVIVKIMQDLLAGKIAVILRKLMDKKLPYPFGWLTNYLVMIVGAIIVVIVQSSSVFRSALTPLVGMGVVTLEKFYPLILGGNVGTTFTGTLAALSADASQLQETLQIALAQTIYNLFGIFAFYPIPFLRHVPIQLAMKLGDKTAKYRWFALVYIAVVFFIVPAILLGISFLPQVAMIISLAAIILFFAFIITINVLQVKYPRILPPFFRNWDFLPIWARSLQPYDKFMVRHLSKLPFCKNRFGKTPPSSTGTPTNDIENNNNNNLNETDTHPTQKLIKLSQQTQV
uniref:Sodium-dependent phosphate transporter n=1 Tax=Panagrolaimus sp. ES5 TaxID=591445 RepID=A0AC34FTK4_9BILA